jgi:sugar lactone lactonase YvrE
MSALYHQVNGRLALIAGHSSEPGFKDGQGDEARFCGICGLAMERGGNVLVSDGGNHSVRRVSPHGQVTTVAGNGARGFADGLGDAARFSGPNDIEVDSQGLIYVADSENHCIRTVQPADGTVSTLCGKGKERGCANGPAAEARFNHPAGLALDMNEDLIVADWGNNSVRKVALPDGRVTTVAGSVEGGAGYADGTGTAARFHWPHGVAVDGSNAILVADLANNRVRKIAGEGGVVTTVAGHGEAGQVDGTGPTPASTVPGA